MAFASTRKQKRCSRVWTIACHLTSQRAQANRDDPAARPVSEARSAVLEIAFVHTCIYKYVYKERAVRVFMQEMTQAIEKYSLARALNETLACE